MSAKRQTQKPEVMEAFNELGDVVEDLYFVANVLDGRSKLSQEAAELAKKVFAFREKLKGELR